MVNSYFPPWRGGAETYVHELAKALVLRGHRVSVVCTSDPLPPGAYDVDGVQVTRLRRLTRLYGTPIQAGLLGELFSGDVDIFHANFPSPYLAFNVALTSFWRKTPAVLTWHNDLPPVTSAARILIETHDRLVLPRYVCAYRRVIATSETYRRISRILSGLGTRVTVVNNGVDCERFHPGVDSTAIRAKNRLEGKFVVLFVGALTKWHRYKGLDVLLNAMRFVANSNRDVQLLVVGDGDLRQYYTTIMNQLHIQSNVRFAGNVPDGELPGYYSACDVLILPSKDMSEGFGLTLLEANATGRPCIASRTGGIPEVIQDGYNGFLVPPNNPESLAAKILSIANDSRMKEEMGRNGRIIALSHDWSKVAERTEKVYQDAINGHSRLSS